MSEVTDLVVIEKSNAMAIFTSKEQLDPLLEKMNRKKRLVWQKRSVSLTKRPSEKQMLSTERLLALKSLTHSPLIPASHVTKRSKS